MTILYPSIHKPRTAQTKWLENVVSLAIKLERKVADSRTIPPNDKLDIIELCEIVRQGEMFEKIKEK